MSDTLDFSDFDFDTAIQDVAKGLILKPLIHTYLYDAQFPAFDLHFREMDMERKPDGWFHPSTHPLMNERALYLYLAKPDLFPVEKKKYMGTLAVTLGKVLHEFLQMCLADAGVLPPELQVCKNCPPEADCHEPSVVDEESGERGHTDGFLDLTSLKHLPAEKCFPNLEIKSSGDGWGKLSKMEDLDLADFRRRWPDYYAQQQSYLRMSGKAYSIVFIMEHQYPFVMKEFHVPYDPHFSADIAAKYRRVRQAVADQRPPMCCGAKGCIVNPLCSARVL